ncbi:poly-beta-1,6-N-acetyl-D-glucosamine biosynthesis protein PgaD [Spiribacter sp. 2438]|uniref:poly-beta-1,6-N-acetyl-D-glucosamine biosynthesis protein PgaD n=1 Tax=Spiribacter sp. 2438 TaxID=2666185 RepID=UPI0012B0CE12|nr:poly-beta-1,6-N-acetyl-D-glucosamine biosynthesis protein PgaD [Spiribacter sp. 2438]QGM21907.1 poly-beta-1,6-N-acetyl-D-glucosamine biosynthesis protein PgaD [Spiribacter sp. 2438]
MKHLRPRIPKVIDRSDLEPSGRRYISQLISLAGWGIWIYLFTPLIADDPMETLRAIQAYGIAIGSAGVIFIGWAGYNWFRFHNNERRHAPEPVGTENLARHFGIDRDEAEIIATARIVTVHFDEITGIVDIESSMCGARRELVANVAACSNRSNTSR